MFVTGTANEIKIKSRDVPRFQRSLRCELFQKFQNLM